MVLTSKLEGIMAEKGLTKRKVAARLGLSQNTFYSKMKSGKFTIDEAEDLIIVLDIKDPISIFFANLITHDATITK